MEYLVDFGYVGLFLAAFAAATILPLSSEIVLGVLLINGLDPIILIGVATCGNVLGSCVNYGIGFWGRLLLVRRVLRVTEEESERALGRFRKYGTGTLLFAWLPVVGDPLTLAAGILKVNITIFLLLVSLGKLARYVVVSYAFLFSAAGPIGG